MNRGEQIRAADELVRRLAAALRGAQLYASGHPLLRRSVTALLETLNAAHAEQASIAIGIVGDDVVVGEVPLPRASEMMGELIRRLTHAGVERIVIDRGVEATELMQIVLAIAQSDGSSQSQMPQLAHIRVGRLQLEQRVDVPVNDMRAFRQLYDDAVTVAERLWESAQKEGMPDADAAEDVVESLAQAVAQNRTALLALTALKEYDNYTFTHMVNVSILTMGQARGLGIDGNVLREFGIAALMHDIGKVKTPPEILTKPDKLTDREYDILKRHTMDGAAILRRTPEMPTLAPIVAFEHHLRADGSGYPLGISRSQLNLGTVLCAIADVYDAMRSQRVYQEAFPTDRILAVLQRNDGTQFDPNLVRRFVQLVGIYPVGNLVLLDNESVAVVLRAYAPDPYRPRVRILMNNKGEVLTMPIDVNLWESMDGQAAAIRSPLDPKNYGLDPLAHL